MPSDISREVRSERTKRLHLNLLIQGAATQESCMLGELGYEGHDYKRLKPEARHLHELIGVSLLLSQIETRSYLAMGRSRGDGERFWTSLDRRNHPFRDSVLLKRHALQLFEESRSFANQQADQLEIPMKNKREHERTVYAWIDRLAWLESRERIQLENATRSRVERLWGIPADQLRASLMSRAKLRIPDRKTGSSPRELINSLMSVGWSQVNFETSPPTVEARAVVLPLLRHELVKGVAELCCAHGLADLDDATYAAVIEATDKVSLERWGMQVGTQLFSDWVQTIPDGVQTAEALMHLARSAPDVVEEVLLASVEDVSAARTIMGHVCTVPSIDLD